jgi:putative ABC transport system permease protein
MIACEQVLVSGAAVAIGFVVGNLASRLYIPLLQISSSAAEQVPPFRIVAEIEDYHKVYAVVAAMLLIGFVALWRIIARIRIDQALKLGED